MAAKAAVDQGHADAVTGFRTEAIERVDDGRLVLVDEDGRRLEPVDEVIVLLAPPCSSRAAQILSRTAAPVPEEDAWARHRPTVRDALPRGTAAPCTLPDAPDQPPVAGIRCVARLEGDKGGGPRPGGLL